MASPFPHSSLLLDTFPLPCTFLCVFWSRSLTTRTLVSFQNILRAEKLSFDEFIAVCLLETAGKSFLYISARENDEPPLFFTIFFVKNSPAGLEFAIVQYPLAVINSFQVPTKLIFVEVSVVNQRSDVFDFFLSSLLTGCGPIYAKNSKNSITASWVSISLFALPSLFA